MGSRKLLPISSLREGPVRQELTVNQTRRIGLIFSAIKAVSGERSLEHFELGFMRDAFPNQEILCWEELVKDFKRRCKRMEPQDAYRAAVEKSLKDHPITVAVKGT